MFRPEIARNRCLSRNQRSRSRRRYRTVYCNGYVYKTTSHGRCFVTDRSRRLSLRSRYSCEIRRPYNSRLCRSRGNGSPPPPSVTGWFSETLRKVDSRRVKFPLRSVDGLFQYLQRITTPCINKILPKTWVSIFTETKEDVYYTVLTLWTRLWWWTYWIPKKR